MAILLADIGGTNARFRWLENGRLSPLFVYVCDDFKTVFDVIDKALSDSSARLDGMIVAGAAPLKNDSLKWTNRPTWKLSKKELKKRYRLKKVLIVNDVQAQGEGLKTLYRCSQTTILMTAGTGLGGCFIVNNHVVAGEVGQIRTEEGLKVEESISGPGIIRLYHQYGGNKKIKSARKIEELRNQKDKAAQEAFRVFYQEWGKLSARLITALYAKGGVFLWGGLVPKTPKDKKILLTAYKDTLPEAFQKIPLRVVKNKTLAFKGLASLSHREFD